MTVIKYFIPEDGDEQAHPNIYLIAAQQPTLLDIKKSFPLPGEYQFRFLKSFGELQVWLDVADESTTVPVASDGGIFAKIARVHLPPPTVTVPAGSSSSSSSSSASAALLGNNSNNSAREENGTAKNQQQQPRQPSTTSSSQQPQQQTGKNATGPPIPPRPSLGSGGSERRNSERLIRFDEDGDHSATQPNNSASGNDFTDSNDLLGFNSPPTPTSRQSSNQSNSSADLFGLDTLQAAPMIPQNLSSSNLPGLSTSAAVNPLANMGGSSVGVSGVGMGGVGYLNTYNPGGSNGPNSPMTSPFHQPQQQQQQQQQQQRGGMTGGYDAFSGLGRPQQQQQQQQQRRY